MSPSPIEWSTQKRPLLSDSSQWRDEDLDSPSTKIEEGLEFGGDNAPSLASSKFTWRNSSVWIILVLITTFNLALFFLKSPNQPRYVERETLGSLRIPNQFIGLNDNVSLPQDPQIRIASYPMFVQPVDSSRPTYTFPTDSRRYMTMFGFVDPVDTHLIVTDKISSIVQFRVRDYGFNRCRLRLSLPTSLRFNGTSSGNANRTIDWFPLSSFNNLELYRLNVSHAIPNRHLTYQNRPLRVSPATPEYIFSTKGGERLETEEFYCLPEQVFTYELACKKGESCAIDVWQDRGGGGSHSSIGILMRQRADKHA